jgi:hypothetical protein
MNWRPKRVPLGSCVLPGITYNLVPARMQKYNQMPSPFEFRNWVQNQVQSFCRTPKAERWAVGELNDEARADQRMQKPYLLITGIPRSGTTLVASLIDRFQDTVCLNEPPRYYEWATHCRSRTEFVEKLVADLEEMRRSLQRGGSVLDTRESNGAVPTNYFNGQGTRRKLDTVPVSRRGVGAKLLLAVKHNEPLTAVLPELCTLECVQLAAIVRHPIPTILSWQSREIAISKGNLSEGYRFWDEAMAIRASGGRVIHMQAKIFELYCSRYWQYRDQIKILKYEEIVSNPVVLEQLANRKLLDSSALTTQNHKLSSRVDNGHVTELKQVMRDHFRNSYRFYPDLDTW